MSGTSPSSAPSGRRNRRAPCRWRSCSGRPRRRAGRDGESRPTHCRSTRDRERNPRRESRGYSALPGSWNKLSRALVARIRSGGSFCDARAYSRPGMVVAAVHEPTRSVAPEASPGSVRSMPSASCGMASLARRRSMPLGVDCRAPAAPPRLDQLADQRIGENGRPAKWMFETVDTMSAFPQPGRFLMRCQPSLPPKVDHAFERAVMSG